MELIGNDRRSVGLKVGLPRVLVAENADRLLNCGPRITGSTHETGIFDTLNEPRVEPLQDLVDCRDARPDVVVKGPSRVGVC